MSTCPLFLMIIYWCALARMNYPFNKQATKKSHFLWPIRHLPIITVTKIRGYLNWLKRLIPVEKKKFFFIFKGWWNKRIKIVWKYISFYQSTNSFRKKILFEIQTTGATITLLDLSACSATYEINFLILSNLGFLCSKWWLAAARAHF